MASPRPFRARAAITCLAVVAAASACDDTTGDSGADTPNAMGSGGSTNGPYQVQYALANIDKLDAQEREALKEHAGVVRWTEVDRQLLLLASPSAIDDLSTRYEVTPLDVAPRPDQLCLVQRARHELDPIEGTVLARASNLFIVQTETPDACGDDASSPSRKARRLGKNEVVARQLTAKGLADGATQHPHTKGVVDALDMSRWLDGVSTLASFDRYSLRPANIAQAAEWIAGQFCAIAGATLGGDPPGGGTRCQNGSKSVRTEAFPIGSASGRNVVFTLGGFVSNGPVFVVGAHYDAIATEVGATRAPGAEDNASGTMAVIEIARAIARFPTDATFEFIAFSGEEQGLYGSTHHVQQLAGTAFGQRVQGVFILDMIGYSGDAELDALLETKNTPQNQALLSHLANMAAVYAPELVLSTSTNFFGSDHVPFLNAGYTGLLSIENDYEQYPYYHSRNDTLANQNARFVPLASLITRMNASALAEWSKPNAFYAALQALF